MREKEEKIVYFSSLKNTFQIKHKHSAPGWIFVGPESGLTHISVAMAPRWYFKPEFQKSIR